MLLSTDYPHCETRLTDWMFARPGFFLVGISVGCNGADRLPKPRRPRLRSTSSSRSSRPRSPTSRRPVLSRTSPCVFSLYQPGSLASHLTDVLYVVRMFQAEDVAQAHPRIVEAVETMLKKGKWTVPGTCFSFFLLLLRPPRPLPVLTSRFCSRGSTGYKEKFGDLSIM